MADSHTVSQKVRQADLDVGLILDPQGQAGLSVLAFAELEVGIVMRPDHPWRGAKALSLGELSLERHIVPGAPLIVHERVALLYRHHDFAPENTISCNDIRLIKSLVLRGSGVTLLSLLDVLDEVQRGQLAFVPAAQYAAATADPGAVYCTLASAFAARANGHSDAECGDRIHGDGQPSGPLRMVSHMPLIMRSPGLLAQLLVPGFGELHILPVGNIAPFARLQHQVTNPVAALGFVLAQGGRNIAGLAENGAQHHCIFHRRAASLANIRGGAVSGIAEQRDAAAHQAAERFDIMDFNAVGSLRVEGRRSASAPAAPSRQSSG